MDEPVNEDDRRRAVARVMAIRREAKLFSDGEVVAQFEELRGLTPVTLMLASSSAILREAELSLKGRCGFCLGNLELVVCNDADDQNMPCIFLACVQKNSTECTDSAWRISGVQKVDRSVLPAGL